MSWVFAAGNTVYKLKKPVRFPYLDFSTIGRREAACRAELAVNRSLAPHVYGRVAPLSLGRDGLSIGGEGPVVDWLVVMRRLDAATMLDRALSDGSASPADLDRLAQRLAGFYRHADRVPLSPRKHHRAWLERLADNRRILSDPRFLRDAPGFAFIDRGQLRFLQECAAMLAERPNDRRIVDGHGDLRLEHISIADPVAIIDRIEFSRRLRIVDPFDELAGLGTECELSGQGWAGAYITRRVARRLHDTVPPVLFAFYRCYRATLRARLAIAHLLEVDGRTPEKWPRLARRYLAVASRDARQVIIFLDARRRRH